MTTKILIADDSRFIHRVFEGMFERYALHVCELVHAHDGQQALSALAQQPDVDLILLDINMPVMNGLEFLEEWGRSSFYADIPVVVVSTSSFEDGVQKGLAAGARDYVVKPFEVDALFDIVSRHVPGLERRPEGT